MTTLTRRDRSSAEAEIVTAVNDVLDTDGILLCGSRATGVAKEDADYDVFVVLPTQRIPAALGRLRTVEASLSETLGAPVSLNPLPRFRLRRPGHTYLVWKMIAEGRILADRRLPDVRLHVPADIERARTSYAMSALRYLLSHVEPEMSTSSAAVAHDIEKALLHVAQLRLLRRDAYASRFEDCLTLLGREGADLGDLAPRVHEREAWFAALQLVLPPAIPDWPGRMRSLLDDCQYLVLARAAGERRRAATVFRSGSVAYRASMSAVSLARAVRTSSGVDHVLVKAACEWAAPIAGRRLPRTWTEARDVLKREWGRVEPLVGL